MTQIEAHQLALVYTTRRHEDKDNVDVIVGTLFIYSVLYFTLIDVESTHSYVAKFVSMNLHMLAKCTSSVVSVVSPLGQSVRVDKVCRRVPLEIQGVVF